MKESETNVAPEGTSPEPAKIAENLPPIAAPGASAAGAAELVQETNVSAILDRILTEVRSICAPFRTELEQTIERAKVDIIAKVAELVTPIVAKSAEPALSIEPSIEPRIGPTRGVMVEDQVHALAVGDPVKVWVDAGHKKFHTGLIAAVHGQGDAYDVTLDYDQSGTKVPADGLEFDDRR